MSSISIVAGKRTSSRVRSLLAAYFLLVVFDGALRKWIFPQWSNEIFLFKDFVLGAAYVIAMSTPYERTESLRSANAFFLGMLGLFLALWLPHATSLRALAGLTYYVACLPLLFLVPYALRSGDLDRYGRLALAAAALVCLVGILQYASPADSWINRYAWNSASSSDISGFAVEDSMQDSFARVRITGTFSYISPMAAFLQTMVPLAWVILIKETTVRRRMAAGLVFAMVLVAILMNGSRAPLAIATVVSFPFIAVALRNRAGTMLVSLAAAAIIAVIGWKAIFSEAYENFAARVVESGDTSERVSGFLLGPIVTMEDFGLVGLGMGSAFGGAEEMAGLKDTDYAHDDTDHDKVGVELGALAYLAIIVTKLTLLAATARLLLRVDKSRAILLWVLLSLAIQASSGMTIPFHNSVASAAYFLSVGLYFYLAGQWRQVQATRQATLRPLPGAVFGERTRA